MANNKIKFDLTGQRFGRWTVLGPHRSEPPKGTFWLCRCDCGTERYVISQGLRGGVSTSCGCYREELRKERSTKHGMSGTPEYHIWEAIIQRCENPNHPQFEDDYGGRGITVCAEFRNSFEAFLKEVGPRPDPSLVIDRIDNNAGYVPGNLHWTTRSESTKNRRKFRHANSTRGTAPTGRRFGSWTVLTKVEYRGNTPQWECQCSCGRVRFVNYQTLLNGRSKSCGHASGDYHTPPVGQKFGRWEVLDQPTDYRTLKRVTHVAFWSCRCKCGRERWVQASNLVAGYTRSCGCWVWNLDRLPKAVAKRLDEREKS